MWVYLWRSVCFRAERSHQELINNIKEYTHLKECRSSARGVTGSVEVHGRQGREKLGLAECGAWYGNGLLGYVRDWMNERRTLNRCLWELV